MSPRSAAGGTLHADAPGVESRDRMGPIETNMAKTSKAKAKVKPAARSKPKAAAPKPKRASKPAPKPAAQSPQTLQKPKAPQTPQAPKRAPEPRPAPPPFDPTVVRTGPAPGRNEPCYCGSGRKYKHCHLRHDEAIAAEARAKAAAEAAAAPEAPPAEPFQAPKHQTHQPWKAATSRGFVPRARLPRTVGGR